MTQQDEGTGDKKPEEMEACKENIFLFSYKAKKGNGLWF